MGKKAKTKGRTSRKLPVASSPRTHPHPNRDDPSVEGVKDPCEHYEKDSEALVRGLSKIQTASRDALCEDCRDEPGLKVEGRGKGKGKGKGKGNKGGGRKKGGSVQSKSVSVPTTMWVCLECSHIGCGGDADISKPYGHARRHHKQNKHVLAARLDDPRVCWCFSCDSLIRVEVPDMADAESKSMKGADSGESVDQEVKGGGMAGESLIVDAAEGYAVRGLINLGNTCFFNSIMQNLFAMDMMRGHFLSLDAISGPLSMALKKLFAETGSGMESSKGIVNPKNFFGCICSKAPQFRGYQQQDSHELLRYLLDGLSTEEVSLKKLLASSGDDKISQQPPLTFVDGLFGGQISSAISCVECGHTSVVCEPFLDLSLPVPSKKVPTKKVVATQPKKAKLPPTSRGRKGRERVSVKVTGLGKQKEERVDTSVNSGGQNMVDTASLESVSNASYSTPADEQQAESSSFAGGDETRVEFTGSVSQTSDETWLDFIEPVSQNSDAIRDAEYMGVTRCRDGGLDPSEGVAVQEESSGEKVVVSPKAQESEIILLPYKEMASTSKQDDEMTRESQNPGNAATSDNLVGATSFGASLSSGCGLAEEELDGLGDLFAEPEDTSGPSTQVDATEDLETSWFSGTASESTEEVVDSADAQVSVDSCLAYFTKPDFLSGEHAWHCENCSRILQSENLKKQTLKKDDGSMMLSMKTTGDISERGNAISSLNGVSVEPSHLVLENGKFVDSAEPNATCSEICGDADAEANGSKKSPNITASVSMVENACQYANGNCSELPCPDVCQANCSKVSIKDDDVADSGSSKYFSCTSSVGKADCQVSLRNLDSGSCYDNSLKDDACGTQALVESSKFSPDGTEETSDTCGYGRLKDSPRVRKKGTKVLPKVHDTEGLDPENVKVKRDATKRILIRKAPPILTIHLKRFGQDARGRLNKLSGHVSFQEMLDLAPYMDQSCRGTESDCYRLVGVVEHSGNMRGGHYIAYVRGQRNKGKAGDDGANRTWFHASDAYVCEASLSEVLQSEAYILFYERVQP